MINDFRLYFLVLRIPRIRGNRYFCNLKRLAQIGIKVHMSVQIFGVESGTGIFVFDFTLEKQMVLRTYSIDPCTLEHICFNVGIILVGSAAPICPYMCCGFIDNELIIREILFRKFKAPLNKIGLVVKLTLSGSMSHFVCDLNSRDLVGIALCNFGITALEFSLYLINTCVGEPIREKVIESKRMLARLDSVLFTKFNTKIGRRSSVYLGTVLCVTRFAALGLKRIPIEGKGRHIEKLCKILFVFFVLFLGFKLIEHKNVCSKTELMRFLINLYLCAGYSLAVLADNGNFCVTLAVVLDTVRYLFIHKFLLCFKSF